MLHTPPVLHTPGGAGRDRTGDLLSANQALSQLSYSPWLGIGDYGLGTRHALAPKPKTLIPNPELCIEADWTLPAGTWPNRQSKSQNLSGDPRRIWTGKAITY